MPEGLGRSSLLLLKRRSDMPEGLGRSSLSKFVRWLFPLAVVAQSS